MSCTSDLSLEGDRDFNSFLENAMYVMPTKTVLNSSVYLSTHDKHNYKNCSDIESINPRKIGGNIEIPSYKGFSIVNADQKSTEQKQKRPLKFIVDGVRMESNPSKRKVHITNIEKDIKDYPFGKPKFSEKKKKKVMKVIEKEKRQVKHTESFWSDCHQLQPLQVKSRSKDNSQPVNTKPYNQAEVKAYMTKKEENRKKTEEENFLLNREKEIKIKKNLRMIEDKRRIRPSNSAKRREIVDIRKMQDLNPPHTEGELTKDDRENESSGNAHSTDSSSKTDESQHSLGNKISAWKPLDIATLTSYSRTNKRAMRQAAVNSKQTCDILDKIQMLSSKMELSKKEIAHFSALNNMEANDIVGQLRLSSSCSSNSKINSSDEELTDSISSKTCSIGPKKDVAENVSPHLIANRTRRKLYNEESRILKETKNVTLQQDFILGLRDENKRRYKESLEKSPSMSLPFNTALTKQVAPVKPYCPDPPIGYGSCILKDDPHRFMKVYQKAGRHDTSSKHHSLKSYRQSYVEPPQEVDEAEISVPSLQPSAHQPKITSGTHRTTDSLETKQSTSMTVDTEPSDHSKTSEVHISLKDSQSSAVSDRRVPYVAKKTNNSLEARLSPSSLERQFQAEIQYYESLEISIQQLLQADKFQGVAVAQQETASLAQLFTTQQNQGSQQRDNNDRLATVLENMTKNIANASRKKNLSYSSSSTMSKTSSDPSTTEYKSKFPAKSSTETDASEIEEEIVDNMLSSMTTPMIEIPQRPLVVSKGKGSTVRKDNVKKLVTEESEITENIENDTGSFEDEVGLDKTDSESKSIKTVSTLKSLESSLTVTDNKDTSPKEISTEKSVEEASISNKINKNSSKCVKKPIPGKTVNQSYSSSSDVSVPTESALKTFDKDSTNRSDSLKELSTPRSVSQSDSRHSGVDYSLNTFENSTAKSLKGDLGNDSSVLEHSDIEARINALIHEKNKKKDLVARLSKDRLKNKNVRKEKTLENQIKALNSQISILENEIANSDMSLSSVSSIPRILTKRKSRKEANKENILPNNCSRSSSSSASLSVHKGNDKLSSLSSKNKTISDDTSSSSTIVSDKNASLSMDDQKPRTKADEIDTPRSVKQLQFGDINEEYSASDRDSSEIRTPSEKSKISREITDNGATKSKSEKFHFLNLNEKTVDEEVVNFPDDDKVPQDDYGMMSARTIHSEISDIPDECVDFSDGEMEEMDNCVQDGSAKSGDSDKEQESSVKDQESSFKDLYSDNFSDASSHKTDKTNGRVASDTNEKSTIDNQPQPQASSESLSPIIPPRRKEKSPNLAPDWSPSLLDPEEHLDRAHTLEDYAQLIDSVSEKELNTFLDELLQDFLDNADAGVVEPLENGPSTFVDKEALASYELLVPWLDECIIPLVDVAVDILFAARKHRTGSTESTMEECVYNLPIEFTSKNDEDTILEMMGREGNTSQPSVPATRHIHKRFIFGVVLEIMGEMYALDDDEDSSAWMRDLYNIRRNRMMSLWRGGAAPESADLVKSIVKDELRRLRVLSGDKDHSMRRSRLHGWFLRQHQDRVDKILVDETIHEEGFWNMYEKLEEQIVFHWSEAILQQLIEQDIYAVTQ